MVSFPAGSVQEVGWPVAIQDALAANQGSLYPALQRLEHRGVITSEWGDSENNRRARFYTISPSGRAALKSEVESWRRFAAAIEVALDAR